MLIEAYCTCGAVLRANVNRTKRQQVLIGWHNQHSGPGHEPTTAAGAEMARTGSGQMDRREARKASKP